jgi:hypothetical protein
MAIIESSTFTGLESNDIRPGRPIRRADINTLAKDQACVYEEITGRPVPGGSGGATAHVHDGTDGAVIPIALASWHPSAALPPKSAPAGTSGFSPFQFAPMYVPTGFSTVRVVALVSAPDAIGLTRVVSFDSSLAQTDSALFQLANPTTNPLLPHDDGSGFLSMFADVAVTPGEVNCIRVDAWESYHRQDGATPLPELVIPAIVVLPYLGAPVPLMAFPGSRISNTDVRVPPTDYHVGTDAFTSFSDHMIADKRALSSYLTTGLQANDALLWELLRGGGTYAGHNHADDTATDLNSSGALIEHPLGSWSCGVARDPGGGTHPTADQQETPAPWSGRIFGHCLTATTTKSGAIRVRFRLPGMLDSHALDSVGGATTKIRAAALVYNDQSKSGGLTVEAQLGVSGGGSLGTEATDSTSTTGVNLLTMGNLDASGSPGDGLMQSCIFRLQQASASSRASMLYGACVWIEP